MISDAAANNLVFWLAQIFVVASVGATLPLVFRIRNPRSHLVYCHLVLFACLILPLVQPWQESIVFTAGAAESPAVTDLPFEAPVPVGGTTSWSRLLLWVIGSGMALKLCWIAIGLWQVRRYRREARPLPEIPESIRAARVLTRADAAFAISPGLEGPATLGYLNPVVLLPESFFRLPEDVQCGIACHELLHVQRRDWPITLFEAALGAAFWFVPPAWWLLAQARLSREQLVDAEVVRLTAGRQQYINALLLMAGVAPDIHFLPAPGFVRKRHLTRRMRFLLVEVPMSTCRLVSSYVCMAAIVVTAGGLAFLWFPLSGHAQVEIAAAPQIKVPDSTAGIPAQAAKPASPRVASAAAIVPVAARNSEPQADRVRIEADVAQANLVHKVDPVYPPLARAARVEDSVALQIAIGRDGKVLEVTLLRGHPLLNQAAINAVTQWVYKPFVVNGQAVEVVTTVTISFSLQ